MAATFAMPTVSMSDLEFNSISLRAKLGGRRRIRRGRGLEDGGGGACGMKGRGQKRRASCCSALCSSVITVTSDSMARPKSSAMWNKLPMVGPLMGVPFSLLGYEGKSG